MALLMEHQFRQLPADRQVETRPFLEAVSYLPPFFGKSSLSHQFGTVVTTVTFLPLKLSGEHIIHQWQGKLDFSTQIHRN